MDELLEKTWGEREGERDHLQWLGDFTCIPSTNGHMIAHSYPALSDHNFYSSTHTAMSLILFLLFLSLSLALLVQLFTPPDSIKDKAQFQRWFP